MKVDIYKSKLKQSYGKRTYVFVRHGRELKELANQELIDLEPLELEKTIELSPGENRIALDSDEAINNIENKGYHIQAVKIEVTEHTDITV